MSSSSQTLYIKKPSGLKVEVNHTLVEPIIYQPTPAGVQLLCEHYSVKSGIDLRCDDFSSHAKAKVDFLELFREFSRRHLEALLESDHPIGMVLTNGQNHAFPVLYLPAENIHGKPSLVIFDSLAANSTKAYYKVAELFPNLNVYLNSGTRQADKQSCITDAICILKQALLLEGVQATLASKRFEKHQDYRQTRFFTKDKPTNFWLFRMPEPLLLTAQRSSYLEQAEADLSYVIRGKFTLNYYRDKFRLSVQLVSGQGQNSRTSEVNSYLIAKAVQHKKYLDSMLKAIPEHEAIATDGPAERKFGIGS